MTNMAASISGGIKASSLASGIKKTAQDLKKFAGKGVGEIWDNSGGLVVRKLDKALFDSGRDADAARKAQRNKNAADGAHKSAFVKAANDAESKYKRENGAKYALMSDAEKTKTLRAERDKAIAKEGAKRNLSADEIERLKNDKGSKYVGNNLVGFGAKSLAQSFSEGKSMFTSENERKIDIGMSASEYREAVDNADPKGREDMAKAVEEGKLYVKKSGAEAPRRVHCGAFKLF